MKVSETARIGAEARDRGTRASTATAITLIVLSLIAGGVLRYALLPNLTGDAKLYLIPWFNFAATHGWKGLDTAFTNYTPFYSYLLLAATPLANFLAPMAIIKSISFVFELANAGLLFGMVRTAGGRPWQASAAFGLVWLAPTVIFNGAAWGQADSLWACFDLLAILMCLRGGSGIAPFGVAFAIKAQGVFLAPFILAMTLRQRRLPWLILGPPAIYLLLAAPTLLAGRPLFDVLTVYVEQGRTFRSLTRDAASVWYLLQGTVDYNMGVVVGMILAAAMGALITVVTWQSRRSDPLFLMIAAACAMLLMPYLLPKMHDRYFYGFEVLSIGLACLHRRYLGIAVAAQLSGFLAYLAYELVFAALLNGAIAIFLLADLARLGRLSPCRACSPPESCP